MYEFIRPLLFRLDAEQAHNLTLTLLRIAGNFPVTNYILSKLFYVSDPCLDVEAFGIHFKNPTGLAAGYDKNGVAVRGLACLGFGHVEVGTVTLFAQAGNPRPRIYRVPDSRALINSMGFPNAGVDPLWVDRDSTRVGINIGKSKDTPLERAADDYCELITRVHSRADYVAINVSSPNTPGLRQLQSRSTINDLLHDVATTRDSLTRRVPLLVKVSPDLSEAEIDNVLVAIHENSIDGIIATNTTLSRDAAPAYAGTSGGLSGEPLRSRATDVIRFIARRTQGKLPIVGVGGISSTADALEKIRAGARLIQIYTGLVYVGPGLVSQINRGIVQVCKREGVKSVAELADAEIK